MAVPVFADEHDEGVGVNVPPVGVLFGFLPVDGLFVSGGVAATIGSFDEKE